MLTSVHFFTQFITIVVNIYGQTELKRPILLCGNTRKHALVCEACLKVVLIVNLSIPLWVIVVFRMVMEWSACISWACAYSRRSGKILAQ